MRQASNYAMAAHAAAARSRRWQAAGARALALLLGLAGVGQGMGQEQLELQQSARLAGSQDDRIRAIAAGPQERVYVAGRTSSDDLLGGSFAGTDDDVFVICLTAEGDLCYVKIFGGSGFDDPVDIDVDVAGNAYVSGQTASTDFPTVNAFQANNAGNDDAFFVKFDPDGDLVYATYYGTADLDGRFEGGVAVAADDRVFIGGRTESASGLPLANAFQSSCAVPPCAFVAGFDPTQSGANSLVYGSYVGGDGSEGGLDLDVDDSGNVYLFGFTGSDNDLVDPEQAFQPDTGDMLQRDHFLVKLDPSLSGTDQRVYSTYIGGMGDEPESGGIVVLDDDTVVIVGETDSGSGFPVKDALQATNGGSADAYIVKADTTQTGDASQIFGTFLGESEADGATGVTVDENDDIWLALVASSSFDDVRPLPHFRAPVFADAGGRVVALSGDGQALRFSTPVASARHMAALGDGSIAFAGTTLLAQFPLKGIVPGVPKGMTDGFLGALNAVPDTGLRVVTTTAQPEVTPGESFVFRYRLGAPSWQTRTGLELEVSLSEAITTESATAGCSFPPSMTCDMLPDLDPGGRLDVFLLGSDSDEGTLQSTAEGASSEAEPDPGDNTDSATLEIISGPDQTIPLPLSAFDQVALSANTGEFVAETTEGVLLASNGVDNAVVNLMHFDRSEALFLRDLSGDGQIAMGLVERDTWTPQDGDGHHLLDAPADRVFATVARYGRVELWTARAFDSGRRVASGFVDTNLDRRFEVFVDSVGSQAQLRFGETVVLSGDPFTGADTDARADEVGDDQLLSGVYGREFHGAGLVTNQEPDVIFADSFEDAPLSR